MENYGYNLVGNPPIFCGPFNSDVVFYSMVLIVNIILVIGIPIWLSSWLGHYTRLGCIMINVILRLYCTQLGTTRHGTGAVPGRFWRARLRSSIPRMNSPWGEQRLVECLFRQVTIVRWTRISCLLESVLGWRVLPGSADRFHKLVYIVRRPCLFLFVWRVRYAAIAKVMSVVCQWLLREERETRTMFSISPFKLSKESCVLFTVEYSVIKKQLRICRIIRDNVWAESAFLGVNCWYISMVFELFSCGFL